MHFVSNFGRLYAGKTNPNPETYKQISYDEFCALLNIAEYAWRGWYNIYTKEDKEKIDEYIMSTIDLVEDDKVKAFVGEYSPKYYLLNNQPRK